MGGASHMPEHVVLAAHADPPHAIPPWASAAQGGKEGLPALTRP